jgi:putative flippase GtrA
MTSAGSAEDAAGVGAEAGPRAPLLLRAWRHSALRFLFFSGVGYSFDVTVLLLLESAGWFPLLANVTIAFVLTYALNFTLNRWFAFDAAHRDLGRQLGRYIPQVSVDYLLTLGGVWLFATVLGMPVFWARLLAATTNLVFNYTVYRFWTFRRTGRPAATSEATPAVTSSPAAAPPTSPGPPPPAPDPSPAA